jgi:hypothetical protein
MPALQYRPTPENEPLDALAGRWASEGTTVATADAPSTRIVGTDIYEWLGGGNFLVHRVHVRVGDDPVEVIELIGEFDGRGYTMRSFDNGGNVGVMRATIDDDGVMTFAGETERTTVRIAPDGGSMTARWERCDDGGPWVHWMDMAFTRLS